MSDLLISPLRRLGAREFFGFLWVIGLQGWRLPYYLEPNKGVPAYKGVWEVGQKPIEEKRKLGRGYFGCGGGTQRDSRSGAV